MLSTRLVQRWASTGVPYRRVAGTRAPLCVLLRYPRFSGGPVGASPSWNIE